MSISVIIGREDGNQPYYTYTPVNEYDEPTIRDTTGGRDIPLTTFVETMNGVVVALERVIAEHNSTYNQLVESRKELGREQANRQCVHGFSADALCESLSKSELTVGRLLSEKDADARRLSAEIERYTSLQVRYEEECKIADKRANEIAELSKTIDGLEDTIEALTEASEGVGVVVEMHAKKREEELEAKISSMRQHINNIESALEDRIKERDRYHDEKESLINTLYAIKQEVEGSPYV